MRTAEEIIKSKYPFYDYEIIHKDVELNGLQVSELINLAMKETIEECAKRAIAKSNSTALENALSGNSYVSQMVNQTKCYVDKESILSLIKELK